LRIRAQPPGPTENVYLLLLLETGLLVTYARVFDSGTGYTPVPRDWVPRTTAPSTIHYSTVVTASMRIPTATTKAPTGET